MSIELELGWGMHDKKEYGHLSKDRTAETVALKRLLDLTDCYDIPITFDIVGHLLQYSCDGYHSGPYPDDWWSEDPGTDSNTNPLFYAPDLVRKIQDHSTEHELTTHTYSHLLAEEASSEALNTELSKVSEIHSEFGLPSPETIVMPRHQHPDYSILTKHGIKTIRRPITKYPSSFSNSLSKFWWLLTRAHPTSTLQMQNGLLETTVTPHPSLTTSILPSGQSPSHPVFSAIPKQLRQFIHQQYLTNAIDRAIKEETHIHLWTHLFNMANDDQFPPLESGLAYLADRRNEGKILITRMSDLQV